MFVEGKEVRKKKNVWEKRGEEEGQTRRKGGEGWGGDRGEGLDREEREEQMIY